MPCFNDCCDRSKCLAAQDTTVSNSRRDRKESRRQQINAKIRQAEEGVLVFRQKQSIFGIQAKDEWIWYLL